jgi:hypothetical protein
MRIGSSLVISTSTCSRRIFKNSSAPAIVMDTINDGSKYPFTLKDKDGNLPKAATPISCACPRTSLLRFIGR